jgi:hypothetical protein
MLVGITLFRSTVTFSQNKLEPPKPPFKIPDPTIPSLNYCQQLEEDRLTSNTSVEQDNLAKYITETIRKLEILNNPDEFAKKLNVAGESHKKVLDNLNAIEA